MVLKYYSVWLFHNQQIPFLFFRNMMASVSLPRGIFCFVVIPSLDLSGKSQDIWIQAKLITAWMSKLRRPQDGCLG